MLAGVACFLQMGKLACAGHTQIPLARIYLPLTASRLIKDFCIVEKGLFTGHINTIYQYSGVMADPVSRNLGSLGSMLSHIF